MRIELLAHFTDEETDAWGAGWMVGGLTQDHTARRWQSWHSLNPELTRKEEGGGGISIRGNGLCRAPRGLERPETEGVAVREESAFRAERLVGSEARKVERGQGMPGLECYSKGL